MAWFDALQAGWRLRCPEQNIPDILTPLTAFRSLARFPGPQHPPCFEVAYHCQCGGRHTALITEPQLDLSPVCDPGPVFRNLLTGRDDWAADLNTELWTASLRRGRWLLPLRCSRQPDRLQPGWPSMLRALEPDSETRPLRMLVHFVCWGCGQLDCQQLPVTALALAARPV